MIVYHIESMIKEFNKRCKPFSAGICESKDLNVGMQIVNVTINSPLEKKLMKVYLNALLKNHI